MTLADRLTLTVLLLSSLASAGADPLRRIALPTKDLAFSPLTQRLYATVGAEVPNIGNSLAVIDPGTATVERLLPLGNNPDKLGMAQDGSLLYVGLDALPGVIELDLRTMQPVRQFTLGEVVKGYPRMARTITPARDDPETVMISRVESEQGPSSEALYHEGRLRQEFIWRDSMDRNTAGETASSWYGNDGGQGLRCYLTTSTGGWKRLVAKEYRSGGRWSLANLIWAKGRVYASDGTVLDGKSLRLLGTFPGVSSARWVAPDPDQGRVYFLGRPAESATTVSLTAFSTETYLQVSSLDLPASPAPDAPLLRFAESGLAFRTQSEVCLLSTGDLVPKALPPAVTVSGTGGIHRLTLEAKGLVYDPVGRAFYASRPDGLAGAGNSVVRVDAGTWTVSPPLSVGSSPGPLAVSSGGEYLYVGLQGGGFVRRVDLSSWTAGPLIAIDPDPLAHTSHALTLAVRPGHPDEFVVGRCPGPVGDETSGDLALCRDGLMLSASALEWDIDWSTAAACSAETGAFWVYGQRLFPNQLQAYSADEDGLRPLDRGVAVDFWDGRFMTIEAGKAYFSSGHIADLQGLTISRAVSLPETCIGVAPDLTHGRLLYLTAKGKVYGFDAATHLALGSLSLTGLQGDAMGLIGWGDGGIAFRTTKGQTFIVEASALRLVPAVSLPDGSKHSSLSATVSRIELATRDLAYSPVDHRLYASIPSGVLSVGNSLVAIDLATLAVERTDALGHEPGSLCVTRGGASVFVAMEGDGALRRFDVATRTADPPLPISYYRGDAYPGPMAPLSELAPDGLAVALGEPHSEPRFGAVALLGLKDGQAFDGSLYCDTAALAGDGVSRLFVLGLDSQGAASLWRMTTNAQGVTTHDRTDRLITAGTTGLRYVDGRLYTSRGQILTSDPLRQVTLLPGYSSDALVMPQPEKGRVLYLQPSGELQVRDIGTLALIGKVAIPRATGATGSIVDLADGGIAFRTTGNAVYIVKAAAIPEGHVAGDLSLNGRIDVADALIALRLALRYAEPQLGQFADADQNGDGTITLLDVLLLLRKGLGLQ